VAAYRAEIQIGVSGQRELERLRSAITQTSEAAESLNRIRVNGGRLAQSLENYNTQLERAQRNLRVVATASDAESKAITEYVTALGSANAARARQNNLIEDEIRLQQTAARVSRLAAAGIRETSGTTQLGPGPASPVGSLVGQKSPVAEKINRTLQGKKDEIELQTALLRLEEKSAAALNEKLELQQRLNRAALAQGKTDVETVSTQQAQRQQFLAGKSGTAMQGPLAPAGAMGFPVALSLSRVEQRGIEEANKAEARGLEIAAKKQEILQRTATTRQALAGLAGNLQRLDQNSVVAIADAARGQAKLVELAKQKAELAAAALKTSQAETKAAVALAKQQQTALAAKRKGRSGMIQNAMIGGAFPMLFGGGAGAVLGGAAGGFIPGNPMMSIVTSALGTMVDQFVAGVTEMGVAVKDLVGNFDKLKEANLFVSKQQEFYIQKLIESGRAAEAAGAIQARIIEIIGTQGVRDLENLGTANTKLQQTFAELTLVMQAFAAGPLTNVLNLMKETVGQYATSGKAELVINQLNKEGKTKEASQLNVKVQDAFRKNFFDVGAGIKEAEEAIREAQKLLKPGTAASISLVDREKTIKQAEQIFTELRDKERAQQELKRQNAEQYADLVRSLQRQQADLNLQYERRAQDLRISNAEKQLDLVKAIGDAQLQQLQNESRARQIDAGGGTGLAAEIATALDTYDIELKRIGQEAADAEQRAKLNILKLDIENERFKLDNAKAIARTNLDNQLRIQRINEQINRQNAELSRRNYEQDISTASINLVNIRADAQANKTIAQAALAQRTVTEDQRAYYTAILKGFEQVLQETEKATEQVARGFIKPSPLPAMAAAPSLQQPGTAAIDAQVNKYKELIAQLTAIETGQNRVNAETAAYLTLVEKTTQFVTQFEAQTVTIENEIEARKLRNRLALEGVAPERIEGELRILELTRAYTQTIGVLDAKLQQLLPVKIENTNEAYQAALGYLAELKALGPLTEAQEKQRKELQNIVNIRERLGTAVATSADNARTTAAAQVQTPQEKIEERIGALKKELADLTNVGNIAITVADGIGTAFGDSFKGIISGSMTAKEALASFFTSVADMFLDMAAQIIAKMITMAILNQILGVLPGIGGAGSGTLALSSNPNVGAYMGGGGIEGITMGTFGGAMAKGGPVSSGQTYMVGERGPELFVPGRSGTIVANDKMGGGSTNVIVNVDAKGSSVEGNEQGANQLGRVISAAVQSELIKQQRPGGILAR
jgi:hypothetical protein